MVVAAAGIAAAGSIAAGAIGSSKSGGSSQTQTASNAPWEAQQPYMKTGLADAENMYRNALSIPLPNQYVAQQNDGQRGADAAMQGMGMLAAQQAAPWQNFGQVAANVAPAQMTNAAAIANWGIGPQSSSTDLLKSYAQTGQMPGASTVDPRLSSSVTQAGMGSIGSLGAGSTLAQQAGQMALNPSGSIDAAQAGGAALSSNPGLDAAISAANRDVNRDLTENSLPAIRAAAMSSGNANSSREGALEAIASRGAADRMADTAAQMRLGAYTQGANLGAQGYNAGLGTAVSAGNSLTSNGATAGSLLNAQQSLQQNQSQFGVTSQLGAASSSANQDLAYQMAQAQTKLAGNQQFGQSIQNGFSNQVNGLNSAITGLNAAYTGASNDVAGQQAAINEGLAQYQAHTTDQQNILDHYWKIAGAGLGSSSTSTAVAQPNNGGLGGAAAGAIGGGLASYNAYRNLTGNTDPFGLRSGANYDPSSYAWGGISGVNPDGTLNGGGQTLQNLGFFSPLPQT